MNLIKKKKAGRLFLLLALALLMLAMAACAADTAAPDSQTPAVQGVADNDILTFIPNTDNRPIIRIATQFYTPDTALLDAMQRQFPDYLFVMDYSASAGVNAENRIMALLEEDHGFDLMITGGLQHLANHKAALLSDLSAEPFLDHYLLSSLNEASVDGRIYSIPGTSSLSGIAFNVDMFEEHGWSIPRTHDEFFALCETIQAAGIKPFSTNFKYMSQVNRLLTNMCYTELFGTTDGALWLQAVQRNEADFQGHMEPLFELAERFAQAGVITIEDFTASLTQQRQAFWAGEYAMIDYDSVIFTYADSENATFELGIMPYPAVEAENSGFAVTAEYFFSVPKYVENDPERLALIKDVLAFISTEEGQTAMLADSLRISNVKNVSLSANPATKYAEEAYARGNLYPMVYYTLVDHVPFLTLQQTAVQSLFEGSSVDEAIAFMDREIDAAFAAGAPPEETYEVIATAEQPLTMLETSYYIADKFREASGAEIALMINGGFFRSNLAHIPAGDISADMSPFVMKGVGAEDYLTVYQLTGAQLKQLLEHPIVNEAETDALIACSGLRIEYAPWNERGSRLLSLTLPDGTEPVDDHLYTVAAWAGVIAEQYISATVQTRDDLGSITDILAAAFAKDGVIKPDISQRVKLVWESSE